MNFIQAFNIRFRCKFHKKIGTKFLFCPYFYILVDEILNAFKNEQESHQLHCQYSDYIDYKIVE